MKFFFIAFCSDGFEVIEDVTQYVPNGDQDSEFEIEQTYRRLADLPVKKNNKLSQMTGHMTLRARFNPQRYYEIYLQSTDDHVTEEDLWQWAETDPQSLVDLVREKHTYEIYSDRHLRNSERPQIV